MKKLRVLVIFDSAGTPPVDQDFTEQFKTEDWLTESACCDALKSLGHEVMALGVYDDIRIVLDAVKDFQPDVAFNLTELFHGKAEFDKNIPALFELLQVPYTGCCPVGLTICNNKALTKKILSYHHIRIPHFHIFHKGKRVWHPKRLNFPLIVKPTKEEASTGIAQASFVENEKDLKDRVKFIHEKFDMPALAEEYIDGRELYASVLGSKRLEMFPFREMKFAEVPEEGPKLATYKAKWDKKYRKKWGIKNEFAGRLPDGAQKRIFNMCKLAYRALLMTGYGRFDLRLRSDGEIFIIEANANPSLAPDDEFAGSADKAGIKYDQLVQRIVNLALQRV